MHKYARRALQTALLTPGVFVEGVMITGAGAPAEPAVTAASLSGSGPAGWVGVAAAVLVVAGGLSVRRAAAPRRARPRTHDVPTQRQAPPTS
jgi:hypothetical protein